MSDIPVTIAVDQSEIDAAIAKLDTALGKTGGATTQGQASAKTSAKNSPATGEIEAFDQKVKATSAQAKGVIATEGVQIKGLEQSSGRIIRMIPGLREAERLKHSIGLLSAGNIAGALGIVMLAYSIYRQVASMLEEQKRQQQEYQQQVGELRNFASSIQFLEWERSQKQTAESYRTRNVP